MIVGPEFVIAMARELEITPAEFVAGAADHVMVSLEADNEDGFVLVPLNKCVWTGEGA